MKVPEASSHHSETDLRSEEFIRLFSARLIAARALDELALRRAERAQKQSGERFDVVLSRLGLVSEPALVRHLGEHFGLAVADPQSFPAAPLFPGLLQDAFLRTNKILPIGLEAGGVVVALSDPAARDAAEALSYLVGRPVLIRIATESEILRAIARLYDGGPAQGAPAKAPDAAGEETAHEEDVRQLADLGSEAPVIRLVNDLIARAAGMQASDIHIEPRDDCVAVRFRMDGVLQTVEQLPPHLKAAITSRIKIMARLNIAEQRLPQDGRIKTTVRGRDLDLRISTMPILRGESVVLRLLDRSSVALDFSALGFRGRNRAGIEKVLEQPNGIILVTGPTGSGKTTTLYTALEALNDPGRKIFTVEDPIEYQIAGINQIQVQPKIGLTFASALRSILRQDPDVILVGEMRDLETAEVAIQASLTGHLVLSTVHTNSAAATVTRLIDMGVEQYLLSSSLKGILAQRLVRRLCEACAVPLERDGATAQRIEELARQMPQALANAGGTLTPRRACGCTQCRNTGFSGRLAVSEFLSFEEAVRKAVSGRQGEDAVLEAARAGGMSSMFEDGLEKVLRGETTLEEVLRSVRIE